MTAIKINYALRFWTWSEITKRLL